ncbi:MAG: hypothetical protein JXB60_03490 [Candidatus Cloacimonetes bacterium]|nr:hypothetical protein [Candidatus Cloacimonadota bacterium]
MENYSEIAFNIVNNFLKIYKDMVIVITGEIHNAPDSREPLVEIPLIEELAVAIRKRNAFPVLEISTQKLKERFFREIPSEMMKMPPHYYNNWLDSINSFIEVGWKSLTDEFAVQEDEDYQRFKKTTSKIWDKIFQQKKKIIFLNFPTWELAGYIGADFDQLRRAYLKAINCNYNLLNIKSEEYREEYFSFSDYQINSETDKLLLKLEKDKPALFAADNPIVILPSGFIEFPVIRDSLHGCFQAEKAYFKGLIQEDVRICFENGNVRFITFRHQEKGNFRLQNSLINSIDNCFLTIGYNNELNQWTNYHFYDRCRIGNISLSFVDRGGRKITFSCCRAEIRKNKG